MCISLSLSIYIYIYIHISAVGFPWTSSHALYLVVTRFLCGKVTLLCRFLASSKSCSVSGDCGRARALSSSHVAG